MYNSDSFDGFSDDSVIDFMTANGYTNIRKIHDGTWSGIIRLAFTHSVCMDVSPLTPFRYRWCFEEKAEALYFVENVKEFDEIPERKQSLRGHRYLGVALYVEKDEFGLPKW
ncbi:hypothetical protein [Serratia quinivorans]